MRNKREGGMNNRNSKCKEKRKEEKEKEKEEEIQTCKHDRLLWRKLAILRYQD
jgi:hypothetical protein